MTDLGETHDIIDNAGNVLTHLPRYGVWMRGQDRYEVVFTTDDRQRACEIIEEKTTK